MGIEHIRHFALTVPDLEAGRQFYTDFGLEAEEREGGLAFRCPGRKMDQVVLIEGAPKSLHHVCFGTSPEGIENLKGTLGKAGAKLEDAPSEWHTDGLWLRDPDGLLISIQDAEEVPWRKDSSPEINAPGQRGRSDKRAVATEEIEIKPRRFGHMLLFTPDLERKAEFFTHALGLGVSDSVETFLRFLYAPTGSDHHIIGLGLSGSPGFQHAGFEVGSVDEVALAGQRMVEKGYINCWGTGRHGPGSNYFHYLRDPWNSIAEYFCDMDYITEGSDWEPRVWQNEDADASWGPHLPPDFLTNFEAIGR